MLDRMNRNKKKIWLKEPPCLVCLDNIGNAGIVTNMPESTVEAYVIEELYRNSTKRNSTRGITPHISGYA